jgi:hypothetical protein
MGSRILKAMQEVGTHAVGNLNSIKIETVANGALIEGADVDNFTLAELGFNVDGERTAKQLSAIDKKAYLVASPETRYLGEAMVDFYNEVGERARIVVLKPAYTRFDTSAFSLNAGVSALANGQVAHFDPATKKFIVSASGTPHANFAGSSAQFVVVNSEDDMEYTTGASLVRLEVSKA